ncbi:hypothetical protein ACFZA2_01835 [Microbacterium sp. NPDC007973]|uniref:hypothetical protein n=1 Tax=Microbacterium sp. NPDC007973 TaxID=3364182 RepID=UPI0036E2DB73
MAKIRDDLDGVVVAVGETGQPIILRAGDTIPKGVEVGDHVRAAAHSDTTESDNAPEEVASDATGSSDATMPTLPPRGGAGSGADAWRAYGAAAAKVKGFEIDIPARATKTDIIEALKGAGIPVE